MLLVTIEMFEINHVLVNVNKFKPYIHTWNLKLKNKNNRCQYSGSKVEVTSRNPAPPPFATTF